MNKIITPSDVLKFQTVIWDYYRFFGRDFSWRNTKDPYAIAVSEIMLQQTQTYRVVSKYEQFIATFTTIHELASAHLRDVLGVWQGLGYNRRGKYLHELAKHVVAQWEGIIPCCPHKLQMLPGIGAATAASICAFAFNIPTIFIETNIRTVFIYYFFHTKKKVHDKEILPFIEKTVSYENPREWYYALMDYGVMLKQKLGNPSRKSVHHIRQAKFEGSDRQLRGKIIRTLLAKKEATREQLYHEFPDDSGRLDVIIDNLVKEGLIKKRESKIMIG